jgi:hypothetical protein
MTYINYATLNALEEFSFIAGNTYTLEFTVYEDNGVTPLDLQGATVDWTLCPYGQTDYTILQKSATITGTNTFEVVLSNTDTSALSGKYIQQPVITAFEGEEYRPAQGVILVLPQIVKT